MSNVKQRLSDFLSVPKVRTTEESFLAGAYAMAELCISKIRELEPQECKHLWVEKHFIDGVLHTEWIECARCGTERV